MKLDRGESKMCELTMSPMAGATFRSQNGCCKPSFNDKRDTYLIIYGITIPAYLASGHVFSNNY